MSGCEHATMGAIMGHLMTADVPLLTVVVVVVCVVVWWMLAGPPPLPLSITSHENGDNADLHVDGVSIKEKAASHDEYMREHAARPRLANAVAQKPTFHWSGALTPVSVLLVEDDEDSRQMLAETLEFYGAHVVAVGSAADALRTLETHHADVLLSDLRLPDKDGFALIRELRLRTDPALATLPAASITASRRTEDRHHALAAGFQVHMEKPLDPDDLVSTVLTLATLSRDERGTTH